MSEFKAKTSRIEKLAKAFPKVIEDLGGILDRQTGVYLDYANMRAWSEKLGWHIDLTRLWQLYDSFNCAKKVCFYYGTKHGDCESEALIRTVRSTGYEVKTKAVKKIRISIDVSSISEGSPDILKNFIARDFLKSLPLKSIEHLNAHLKNLNNQGVLFF